jgi:arsenate reductase-like glutaredoxin family protein
LLEKGAALVERDLGKQPLSEAELKALFGERDPRDFLNPRNELYRTLNMKEHPPSPAETIRLIEPNLIRRPLAVRGREIVIGHDEAASVRSTARSPSRYCFSAWDAGAHVGVAGRPRQAPRRGNIGRNAVPKGLKSAAANYCRR